MLCSFPPPSNHPHDRLLTFPRSAASRTPIHCQCVHPLVCRATAFPRSRSHRPNREITLSAVQQSATRQRFEFSNYAHIVCVFVRLRLCVYEVMHKHFSQRIFMVKVQCASCVREIYVRFAFRIFVSQPPPAMRLLKSVSKEKYICDSLY